MNDSTRWWVVGTGVVMAIGSFLPWARAGFFSVSGTDGDGIITLVLGVVVAIIGVANRQTTVAGVIVLLSGAVGLWITWTVFGNLTEAVGGSDITSSVGGGMYLTMLGSLFAAIAGLQLAREAMKAAKVEATPDLSE